MSLASKLQFFFENPISVPSPKQSLNQTKSGLPGQCSVGLDNVRLA
jgi:hypothetical protein